MGIRLRNDLRKKVSEIRKSYIRKGIQPVPDTYQGVDKNRIKSVLEVIDCDNQDMIDVVFSLLDNDNSSMFSRAPDYLKFTDGATVAHIGCHVGILQRGGNKLDREGRDYWIKPLRDLGAIEAIYFQSEHGRFIEGHPKPKSPNSAYRLHESFKAILLSSEDKWHDMLIGWINEEKIRERVELQAKLAQRSKEIIDSDHSDLIKLCEEVYVPKFLRKYRPLFIDDADGDRITDSEFKSMSTAGIEITLADAMPDLLLYNQSADWLWVIEAVTSDGEVDIHKFNQLTKLADRFGKSGIGFTTAYLTWKAAAKRQSQFKNLAPNTYIWIAEDPSKHFHVLEMLSRLDSKNE